MNGKLERKNFGSKASKVSEETKSSTKADPIQLLAGLSKKKDRRCKGQGIGPLGKIRSLVADAKLADMVDKQVPGEEFTLEEIAEHCGVTRESVRLWEAGALKSFRRKFQKIMDEYRDGHWE